MADAAVLLLLLLTTFLRRLHYTRQMLVQIEVVAFLTTT